MPANTVYEFVPEPNFAKAGTYKTRIRLLYPDNSMETSQEVTVSVYDHTWKAKKNCYKKETSAFLTVTANNPADSSRYTPVLLAAKTQVGKAIAASSLIANFA
nr:Rib/alpha-like domain-containing protein [Lactobacillus delbrueckii]